MKILICTATELELNAVKSEISEDYIDFLVTGFGPMFTIYNLQERINQTHYDLVLDVGICGSYTEKFPVGTVVNVFRDEFADLGITDKDNFRTAFEHGFLHDNDGVFSNGQLFSSYLIDNLMNIEQAKGITVSNASGEKSQIAQRFAKFQADVESMEGASVFYVCRRKQIPCLQIRAVSNRVEERNVSDWNIPLALQNLAQTLVSLLPEIASKN